MNDIVEPQLRPGPPPPPSSPPPSSPQDPSGGPRPGRTVSAWLVVGLLLAAVTIVQGAGTVIAVIGRESDTVERTVDARPELVVRLSSGDVRVTAATASTATPGTISLRAHRTWSFNEPELAWSTDGDRLELTVKCGFALVGWCSADLDLTVPEDTRLDVHTDSGRVSATGLHGDVRLKTDSGRVTARDITGSADLSTDSGNVEVNGVRGDLVLQTDSGSIDVLGSSAAKVEADTDSGSVSLELLTDPQQVLAKTDSGDVEIRVPDTAGVAYVLDLQTDSGSTEGGVRTDPASSRSITASSDSGDVTVSYR